MGAIGGAVMGWILGAQDAKQAKRAKLELNQNKFNALDPIAKGTGSKQDYYYAQVHYNEIEDGENLLAISREAMKRYGDQNWIDSYFENKALFYLKNYEDALTGFEGVLGGIRKDRYGYVEEGEVLFLMAVIQKRNGQSEAADKLRQEALKIDRRNNYYYGLRKIPW